MSTFPNYIRTLLLNESRGSYPSAFPGEEYVSADFVPRVLSTPLRKAHAIIFGADPDRYMLNFRLHQLMPVIHSSELAEFITAADDRITYLPFSRLDLVYAAFTTSVTPVGGAGTLTPIGDLDPDESAGKLFHWWKVTVLDGTYVVVDRLTDPTGSEAFIYTMTGGMSNLIPLIGSSQYFNFSGGVGDVWYVQGVARPVRNTSDILTTLVQTISEDDEEEIFGETPIEPMITFRNLWRNHDFYAYRMGALLLALAYSIAGSPEVT